MEALVHAALVAGTRCVDPHHHQPCPIETLMDAIGLQRRLQGADPQRVEAFGFTPWKQRSLKRFLAGSELRFRLPRALPGPRAEAVAVWGRRARPRLLATARQRALPLLQASVSTLVAAPMATVRSGTSPVLEDSSVSPSPAWPK